MPPFKVGFQFFHFSSTKEETLAEQIVGDGLTFLQAYAKLASLAYASSRPLFAYRPTLFPPHSFGNEGDCSQGRQANESFGLFV